MGVEGSDQLKCSICRIDVLAKGIELMRHAKSHKKSVNECFASAAYDDYVRKSVPKRE